MSVPVLPPSAPFSPSQRAWLNGFFAAAFNLDGATGVPGGAIEGAVGQSLNGSNPSEGEDEDFPWHDPALPLDERMNLAEGKSFKRVLMAAMAQLDCGQCGYLCQSYAEAIADGADKDLSKCVPGGKDTQKKLKQIVAEPKFKEQTKLPAQPRTEEPRPSVGDGYNRLHPFPAAILDVRPLTRKDSAKDVRFVRLSLRGSGLKYEVGDALGVYPENDADLVEELLSELEASGEEPTRTPEGWVIPARLALSKAYIINRTSEAFIQMLADCARDECEQSRLQVLAEDDAEDFLEGRDVLDILREFPSARSNPGTLISALAPQRPRLYSISSSLKAHPDEVHLTVGLVRYSRQGCSRSRKGVASNFLCERAPGHKVGVFVQEAHAFRPPSNPDAPMIMVGPGTGIAPFRAFLEERRAVGARGKNWLFFGDQRRECDFLYQTELEQFQSEGTLHRLDLAFSRDQAQKIYVQHRMLEAAAELWAWLQEGAHFYVCGDASRMAKDVDAALHQIVREQGRLDEDAAKAYVAALAKGGRYGRDVY
jgi:sulfite reductase (NADPH) flavoprotein alpha-component